MSSSEIMQRLNPITTQCRRLRVHFFVFLVFWIPAFIARVAALEGYQYHAADIPGFLSDIAAGALITAILSLVPPRALRILLAPLALIYAVFLYANYEVIGVLDGNIDFSMLKFALHPTFIQGSLFAVKNIPLLCFLLIVVVFLSIVTSRVKPVTLSRSARLLASVYLCCIVILSLKVETYVHHPRWRQYNLIIEYIQQRLFPQLGRLSRHSVAREGGKYVAEVTPEQEHLALEMMRPDLTGESILTEKRSAARNVLLIVVESLSGWALQEFIYFEGKVLPGPMPLTRRWLEEGLYIPNAVALNRGTINGLWGILCGTPPSLTSGSAKFFELSEQHELRHHCLPSVLRKQSISTHFMQAAALSFMSKDRYLGLIGYEESKGAESFPKIPTGGSWGFDDSVFFQAVLDKVQTLARGDKPWHLAALNVGTHHPYYTPRDFQSEYKRATRPHSLAHLDKNLNELFIALRDSGVLEDTLVILTSDEGHKHSLGPTSEEGLISGAWIPLAFWGPGVPSKRVATPFGQGDILVSIHDYFQIPISNNSPATGRSAFRQYSSGRYLPFAYSPDGNVFLLTPLETVLGCTWALTTCVTYSPERELFSSPLRHSRSVSTDLLERLRALVVTNYRALRTEGEEIELHFMNKGIKVVPVVAPVPRPIARQLFNPLTPNKGLRLLLRFVVLEGRIHARASATDLHAGVRLLHVERGGLEEGTEVEIELAFVAENGTGRVDIPLYLYSEDPTRTAKVEILQSTFEVIDRESTQAAGTIAERLEVVAKGSH